MLTLQSAEACFIGSGVGANRILAPPDGQFSAGGNSSGNYRTHVALPTMTNYLLFIAGGRRLFSWAGASIAACKVANREHQKQWIEHMANNTRC
jgi:hypothetical protein